MSVTKNLAKYIQSKGINLSFLSRETGIPYMSIYSSLGSSSTEERDLRADELINICTFLEVNPLDFADPKYSKRGA